MSVKELNRRGIRRGFLLSARVENEWVKGMRRGESSVTKCRSKGVVFKSEKSGEEEGGEAESG